mmetsp:Transcript_39469/g.156718  ORF Transcript_39469/g.156718 Transcript_39469/m.156718 type:complete len:1155 (-) Transcript_39469:451-3915(-)|eukprot:CAMPEP_0113960108 /NCGR_PEP_ID=MMETSP0011_2-20120614/4525_1 /TAXON_ID=101924 /ORGANISM="Rhodosorus marinus" /LENGTH=1154 /DNA_ID=CAMNT_0000971511 /DNA_START=212 /DNA_END=3676 /DNA_ORIENTATION=+ /assembly_acc=CAM_ASM_000156
MEVGELPERLSFPQEEENVQKYWERIGAFEKSNELSKGRKVFSFYDGPPFATGLPHYGHILAGTIKDVVTRYAYQTGHHVERRFGWDCHGLPIEFEIEQALGIKTKEDVLKFGIGNYNKQCRQIVMRFAGEWERIVKRLGRWIDFENDYKTLSTSYMESVWWVFKQLYEKGLVYRGFKVMPYSTGCTTPLSNFEANLNYKDVQDPAVTAAFPLKDDPNTLLLAWTTTPWTLPSNMMLCVNAEMSYIKILDEKTGKTYVLAESRLVQLYKDPKKAKFTVLERYQGSDMVGWKYEPLFDYFVPEYGDRAFFLVSDDYVTDDSGTGIVHQAPAFGEDDYRVCVAVGAVDKSQLPCPVDESGRFLEPVHDFVGVYVKEADKLIVDAIKKKGRIVKNEQYFHSYPFCWRSETPLIYKAVPAWFVKAEELKDKLLENNLKSSWVPKFVQTNRFGNWLENVRDWNVSRNRYWGTPLPIWTNEAHTERLVIGSVEELETLCGKSGIVDIHRENIDDLEIVNPETGNVLKRVEEVFDCWFESGSMPYASIHYPFTEEARNYFGNAFPADFIAEGLDQTRGWFYTLTVLATALYDKPAFKNCIVNGLVLAEDGKKMSKRLKNYPDPMTVVNEHGSDALRLYLINSPVVRAEPLRFREAGVRDVVKEIMLPWFNAYRFFVQNAKHLEFETGESIKVGTHTAKEMGSRNPMDHWVMSSLGSLIHFVRQEMAAYRLFTVVPRLVHFIEDLTNWYVRLNRPRLKGAISLDDWRIGLENLADVLLALSRLMASFTPFFSEYTYQNLKNYAPESLQSESVHFLMVPELRDDVVDEKFEAAVGRMQEAITLGRVARERRNVSLKQPLGKITLVHRDQNVLDSVMSLESYVKSELNVQEVVYSTLESEFVVLKADADGKILGKKLGKSFAKVHKAVRSMTSDQVQDLESNGSVEIEGHKIEACDIRITRDLAPSLKDQAEHLETAFTGGRSGLLALLDLQVDEELEEQGTCREVVNRVQKLRKHCGLNPKNRIEVYYWTSDAKLGGVIARRAAEIGNTLKSPPLLELKHLSPKAVVYSEAETKVGSSPLRLCMVRAAPCPSVARLAEAPSATRDSATSAASYILARESGELHELMEQLQTTKISIDDVEYELKPGYNVFKSNSERLAAGAPP